VHFSNDSDITIALTPVPNPCEFGIVRVDETGRILEFKEKPRPEEVFSNLINAGVYIMDRSVLRFVPEGVFFDFSKDLVPVVMADGGHIHGFELSGLWMDVGRPHDLLGANLAVAERSGKEAPAGVKGPFYLGDGASVTDSDVDHAVILMGAAVGDSVLDHVLVMKDSTVAGSTLRNTIVGEGCTIGEGSIITNAVLADNTVVEPGTEMDGGRIV
ncbi:MAG: NDP-sugar synthase, partial [Candidatus Methanomethylophilaceae archaeon]|nr:NDP-sugar synthase [Candidatus Methanomethylophilaceae archaeon]